MNQKQSRLEELLPLLRNPDSGNALEAHNGALKDSLTGECFTIREGIPVILRRDDVFGWNRKQQKGYDWGSFAYDLLYKFAIARRWLAEISEIMEVGADDCVLETSIGTGQQLLNLQKNGFRGRYFGNDISFGMLRKCQKNLKKWHINAGLVQGNAEALPYGSELFDVVFHVGGFNFFNDKEKAIGEMIRVGKPGAKIYVVDESDVAIREKGSVFARATSRFMPAREAFIPPVNLVPENMLALRDYMLLDNKFWMVSFQKPGGS